MKKYMKNKKHSENADTSTYVTFDPFVKVICAFIIRCILSWCQNNFVPKLKFRSIGSVEFEIRTFLWRKRKWRHHDVIESQLLPPFTRAWQSASFRRLDTNLDQKPASTTWAFFPPYLKRVKVTPATIWFFMKFKHKSAKGKFKRLTKFEFEFDQT